MRVSIKDMLGKLNVPYVMGGYETFPWSSYQSETGITCSAEVRMGPTAEDMEAEVQMLYDEPPADGSSMMKQICHIWMSHKGSGEWAVDGLKIKGKPLPDEIYNWEQKCCNFFRAVTTELAADKIPDIEDLLKKEMHNRDKGGGNNSRGSGGSKAPKVKGDSILGNKKSGF